MSSANSAPGIDAPMISPQKAWQAALGELQLQVTSDIFEMYLHPTRFWGYEDGTFVVTVPNGFVKDWLEMRLNRIVKKTLRHIVHREVEINYMVQPQAMRDPDQPAPTPLLDLVASYEAAANGHPQDPDGLPLVADYVFDTFIVGSNNRMAHAASVAVADRPGGRYNPLFLYSGVGLGKTHLMHAIAQRTRQNGYKAVYVSCEVFTNELVTAIRTNTQEQFRAKFRTSDVLLVDDIQFLAGKASTQEEFFHTFNALHAAGKQVILACDRPPKAMATLESRLRSRFEWGLITDIQAPDLEMRLAILEAKAEAHDMALPYPVLERIAQLVPTNIRELEGALTKVVAHASLVGVRLTPDKVDAFLADIIPPRAQVEPEIVLAVVARETGISLEQLTGPIRKHELVQARQIAMYLLRKLLNMPYAGIGALFGGRDHATVMHSIDKIDTLMLTDDALQRQIDTLKAQLTSPQLIFERIRG